MTDIQNLIRERAPLKARLTNFEKFVTSVFDKLEKDRKINSELLLELERKVERQEQLCITFDKVQTLIENHDSCTESQYLERENFENKCDSLLSKVKVLILENREMQLPPSGSDDESRSSKGSSKSNRKSIKSCVKSVRSDNSKLSCASNVNEEVNQHSVNEEVNQHSVNENFNPVRCEKSRVELPRIKMPVFKGSYDLWPEFRDTFLSLIDKRKDLDNLEKFYYLRLNLDGEAKGIISQISFCEKNYKIAWNLLVENYENKYLAVYNHLKELTRLPKLVVPSAAALKNLINQTLKHINCLKELGVPADQWDVIIIFLMSEKLDNETETGWEESNKGNVLPTIADFSAFLRGKISTLEKIENKSSASSKSWSNIEHRKGNKSRHEQSDKVNSRVNRTFASTVEIKCLYCKENHLITNCNNFLKLSVSKRFQHCKGHKMCLNCLKLNHLSKDCRSSSCRKCNGRHHTLLHFENNCTTESTTEGEISAPPSSDNNNSDNSQAQTVRCNLVHTHNVLLSTAQVNAIDVAGNSHSMRVLLDSGSQSNFVTEEVCDKLRLKKYPINISVVGITQVVSKIKYKCDIKLVSQQSNFQVVLSCLVVSKISEPIPAIPINSQTIGIPCHINLADREFHRPAKIDILIGAEVFYNLLIEEKISLGKGKPIFQNTVFGWVTSGPIPDSFITNKTLCSLNTLDIQNQLERFWAIEDVKDVKPILSRDEEACELIFQKTTTRDLDGSFIVDLPLRESPQLLGDSKEIALRRFASLERKLHKNPVMRKMYDDFMSEYIQLGHMRPLDGLSMEGTYCFLPHHGVLNESKLTTKLRVVFDASCPTDNDISLNDILLVGPSIQDDLFNIIVRFRQHCIVICADVEKMYRMVKVNAKHQPLQCIFWRFDSAEQIQAYHLCTVTYGTASAPFLAVRCLEQLARDHSSKHPEASKAISRDFYVDDFISGADTIDEAIKLASNVSDILKSGSFNLRKWVSNKTEVLANITSQCPDGNKIQLGEESQAKLLGLFWSGEDDSLTYSIKMPEIRDVTKRTMLSEISQIFDPLGLLAPCIILVKIMLQRLWFLKLTWDDIVPSHLASEWIDFRNNLKFLNSAHIPRRVVCDQPIDIQLHGFADASQEAYGACVYLRSQNSQGQVQVSLLCAKGRVAPVKTQTVNRLELCGALVLAQLVDKVASSMTFNFSRICLWTDSSVVLCWIRSSPHLLQQFVANRISTIQQLTDVENWHHVSTHYNPADLISRGINPSNLLDQSIWWHGPDWLTQQPYEWPNVPAAMTEATECCEFKNRSFSSSVHSDIFPFTNFSKFTKLRHAAAYCNRFIYNCRNVSNKRVGPLNANELTNSELLLAKLAQLESFPHEINRLSSNQFIKSNIKTLSPFFDDFHVIRVGGRLQNANFPYNKTHPILLSGKHHFAKLLMTREHLNLFHAGPLHMLSSIRERYWITSGRVLAKQVVRDCIRCQRAKPNQIQPIMGSLPKNRLLPTPPFFVTGVDYAGPIQMLNKKGRNPTLSKCYIALFVCFSTKAIHLELVSELTSEAFLATLRRFISRRGKPHDIYSDNGTTFVGAKAELDRFTKFAKEHETLIQSTLGDDGINWHFIPAHSPHFGGLWEAGVKSSKFHLKRVLGDARLTFEDLYTVLVQVEAILNSRPITPLSSDPNDYNALTPAHFLIGRPLTTVPDDDFREVKCNRLSRFERARKICQHFWTRWSKEFVSELQSRTKWCKSTGQLQPDTLVLIREDNLPPLKWRLGRVVSVIPGADNVGRVAHVKTATGIIKRSFAKLCPLTIPDSSVVKD